MRFFSLVITVALATGCHFYFEDDSEPVDEPIDNEPIDEPDDEPPPRDVLIWDGCDEGAGYTLDYFTTPRAEERVRLVGIYEAGHFNDFYLDIVEPGSFTLILTAYETTKWEVRAGPETEITRIYTFGHGFQVVTNTTAAPVISIDHNTDPDLNTIIEWPRGSSEDDDFDRQAISAWESVVGAPITEFFGCYSMDGIHTFDI